MGRQRVHRWSRPGAVVVTVALAVALAAGCGSKSEPGSATTPTTTPTESVYSYLRGIVTRAAVGDPDLAPILTAACAAYADGVTQGGDSASFDQWVADLFNVDEGGLDQERVNGAVANACTAFDGDVRRFATDLSAALGVGIDELRGYIATACAGFEQRRRANDGDPNAPKSFDPLVSDVFAKGGVDRTDLAAMVDAACRDFAGTPPPTPASRATTPP